MQLKFKRNVVLHYVVHLMILAKMKLSKIILIDLKFRNELINKLESLELLVTESDIAFDLIIGRQAIKQNNLAQKIPSHFLSMRIHMQASERLITSAQTR